MHYILRLKELLVDEIESPARGSHLALLDAVCGEERERDKVESPARNSSGRAFDLTYQKLL